MVTTGRQPINGVGTVVLEDIEEWDSDDKSDACHSLDGYVKGSFTTLQYSYPLKILVPSHASASQCQWVYPITFGGGLVGGDSINLSFTVRRNCCGLLTGQESTKVYHCEDDRVTTQNLSCDIEADSLLCVLSDPVVCYRRSNFQQKQTIRMSSAGNLVYLDWLIGGRVALNELWQFDRYQNKTDIYIDDRLVYRDNYHMKDGGLVGVKTAMEPFQVIGTCILLGQQLHKISANLLTSLGKTLSIGDKRDRELVTSISPLHYTVGDVSVPGVYIRFIASTSGKAYTGVIAKVIEPLLPVLGGNPFKNKY